MNDLNHEKIRHGRDLIEYLKVLRTGGKKIVFTNGCYDILHPGHVDLLERAKALGDVLILALNSDVSVRRLGKGEDRPVNSLEIRAFMAAHLASVDIVTSFDDETPEELIKIIVPDVLVKGGDWPLEKIAGREIVEQAGGKTVSLPLLGTFSTTSLLKKIRS